MQLLASEVSADYYTGKYRISATSEVSFGYRYRDRSFFSCDAYSICSSEGSAMLGHGYEAGYWIENQALWLNQQQRRLPVWKSEIIWPSQTTDLYIVYLSVPKLVLDRIGECKDWVA